MAGPGRVESVGNAAVAHLKIMEIRMAQSDRLILLTACSISL